MKYIFKSLLTDHLFLWEIETLTGYYGQKDPREWKTNWKLWRDIYGYYLRQDINCSWTVNVEDQIRRSKL